MQAALDFAGHAVQGVGAYDAGKYTRNIMEVNATNTERDAAQQGEAVRADAGETIGRQQAAFASSGFQPNSGSALVALRESLINRDLRIAQVRRAAASSAQNERAQGELALTSGYNQMTGSLLSGAASAMHDLTKAAASAGQ